MADADTDGVSIEVEDVHENANLQNEAPLILQQFYKYVLTLISSNGWYILLAIAVVYYLSTYLKPYYQNLMNNFSQDKKMDSETAELRNKAMEEHRRKLQEKFDSQSAIVHEAKKLIEEEKRQQKIKDWENHTKGQGYKSKVKPQTSEPEPISNFSRPARVYRNDDYNPLGGDGGTCSWKPSAKGGAAKGG